MVSALAAFHSIVPAVGDPPSSSLEFGTDLRLPDKPDANPTAPVGHAEIRESPVITEEVGRTRDWSFGHGGGTKSASESRDFVPLILHNVVEGGGLVKEGLGGSLGDPLQLPSISIGTICLKEGEGRTG